MKGPENEFLKFVVSPINSQCPLIFGPGGGSLQNFIAEVEDVYPMQQFAFAIGPCFDSLKLL